MIKHYYSGRTRTRRHNRRLQAAAHRIGSSVGLLCGIENALCQEQVDLRKESLFSTLDFSSPTSNHRRMDDSDNLDIASPGNGEADATTTGTSTAPQSLVPKQLSLPLPLSIHTALRLHLTQLETSNLIFLTTTDPSTSSSSTSALGSFVYAIPNVSRGTGYKH